MGFYADGMGYATSGGEGEDKFSLEINPEFTEDRTGRLTFSNNLLEFNIFHTNNIGCAVLNRQQAKDLAQAIDTWLEKTQ